MGKLKMYYFLIHLEIYHVLGVMHEIKKSKILTENLDKFILKLVRKY